MAGYGDKDEQQIYQLAERVYSAYGEAHKRINEARNLVRYRLVDEMKELEAQAIRPAYSSRPLATVHQARAFADDAVIEWEVLDFDNSLKESRKTTKLERWLGGVKGELARTVGFPIADFFYDYFEAGRGILKLGFDETRACAGEFPFLIESVDPAGYARVRSNRGLVFVVEKETKDATVLCDELYGHYGDAKAKRSWKIPDELKELEKHSPYATVELTRCYDREYEWCYLSYVGSESGSESKPIVGQLLWKREHCMGQVPYVEAFCVPTTGNRPEELGMGVIYPVLSMLRQENILFSKFANDAEVGSRPLAHYIGVDGAVVVEQVYPGYRTNGPAREWKEMILSQNEVVLDKLSAHAQNDIARMTFPEIAFSGNILQLSGEAYRQALSGLGAKLKQFMNQPQVALSLLASMLLERVEYFMTPEMARTFSPKDTETYMQSCSVALSVKSSRGKEEGAFALTAKDVKGHYRVNVTIEPSLPQDDNARIDRFVQVRGAGVPFEIAVREHLHAKNPEEYIEAYNHELLMAEYPEYKKTTLDMMLIDKLERDEAFAHMFLLNAQKTLEQAEQEQQAAMEQQAQQPPMEQPPPGSMPPPPQLLPPQGGQPLQLPATAGMGMM